MGSPSLLLTGYAGKDLRHGLTGMVRACRVSVASWTTRALGMGRDHWGGWFQLLQWIDASPTPPWFREIPAVEVLRQVWVQQFYRVEGALRWRQAEDLPPSALMLCSPDDAEAR